MIKLACNPSCFTCVNSTSSGCFDCFGDLKFYKGKCFENCPEGTFLSNNNKTCEECKSTCLTCKNSQTCESCGSQLYFQKEEKKCVAKENCYIGTYGDDTTRKCELCDSTCKTCNGPSSQNCLSCNINLGYFDKNPNIMGPCKLKTCVSNQYLGTNPISQKVECINCLPECETCDNKFPGYCIKCKKKYIAVLTNIVGYYQCRLCEFYKGLKSPAILGSPCEGN